MFEGHLPDAGRASRASRRSRAAARTARTRSARPCPAIAAAAGVQPARRARTALSLLGAPRGVCRRCSTSRPAAARDALLVCAAAGRRSWPRCTGSGGARSRSSPAPTWPRRGLPVPCSPARSRRGAGAAIEHYLISPSTTGSTPRPSPPESSPRPARTSSPCLVGAIGALSGPLHGGAPSRALDTLDAIGTPDRIDAWVRRAGARRRPDHGLRPRRLPDRGPALADAARRGESLAAGLGPATWSTSPSRSSAAWSTSWPSSSPAASCTPTSSSTPAW